MHKSIEWCAGLFEGEGCITWKHNGNGKMYPRLYLKMTDRDVVEKFADGVGYGNVNLVRSPRSDWKDAYAWEIAKTSEVHRILDAFLPHLGNRRAHKALDVLDHLELTL